MDAAAAFNTLEALFRELIKGKFGDDWHTHAQTTKIVPKSLQKRMEAQVNGRRGMMVKADLLEYTNFKEVADLILDNWGDFADVLGERLYGEAYIERLKILRNATQHGKALAPFEEHMTIGIVGEFEQMITKHQSQQGPDSEYFPVILLARDCYGHDDSQGGLHVETELELKIGRTITFHYEASDPASRELTWRVEVRRHGYGPSSFIREIGYFVGDVLDFEWIVESDDVGVGTAVRAAVTSSGEHHRHGLWDDDRWFWYNVLPPKPRDAQ